MNNRKNENGFISFHLGCDLGKENDFTAICFLRKFTPLDRRSRVNGSSVYEVLMMKRFALKTSYVQIVSEISNRLKRAPFDGWQDNFGIRHPSKIPTFLAFDQTGVGQSVSELLRNDAFLDTRLEQLYAINITAGREPSEGSDFLNIPKRDLIMNCLIAFEKGYLQFAGDMPELPLLIDELQNFEMRFTAKGNSTFSAKGSTNHDDLVLSLSLAVWSAKNTDESFDEDLPLKKAILWSGKHSPSRF
ncbi:MAG: hypothetical protein ACR2MG_20370 [Pyrinomonadaceae bacterium]